MSVVFAGYIHLFCAVFLRERERERERERAERERGAPREREQHSTTKQDIPMEVLE